MPEMSINSFLQSNFTGRTVASFKKESAVQKDKAAKQGVVLFSRDPFPWNSLMDGWAAKKLV